MLFVYCNYAPHSARKYSFIEVENPSMDPTFGVEAALNDWGKVMDANRPKGRAGQVVFTAESTAWRVPEHRMTLAEFFCRYAFRYEDEVKKALRKMPSNVLVVIAEQCKEGEMAEYARQLFARRHAQYSSGR